MIVIAKDRLGYNERVEISASIYLSSSPTIGSSPSHVVPVLNRHWTTKLKHIYGVSAQRSSPSGPLRFVCSQIPVQQSGSNQQTRQDPTSLHILAYPP
ncbi:hypothetical protein Hanom_Chr16g01483261 [Helianthus anomalus]